MTPQKRPGRPQVVTGSGQAPEAPPGSAWALGWDAGHQQALGMPDLQAYNDGWVAGFNRGLAERWPERFGNHPEDDDLEEADE